jgi:hypothetical protein
MSEPQNPSLEELLPRMQFVFLGIMWPPYRWIRNIWIRESNDQYQLVVQTTAPQSSEKMDGFRYLVGEVIESVERTLDKTSPASLFMPVTGFAAEPIPTTGKPPPSNAELKPQGGYYVNPSQPAGVATNPSAKPTVDNGGRADPPPQRFLGNRPIIEK